MWLPPDDPPWCRGFICCSSPGLLLRTRPGPARLVQPSSRPSCWSSVGGTTRRTRSRTAPLTTETQHAPACLGVSALSWYVKRDNDSEGDCSPLADECEVSQGSREGDLAVAGIPSSRQDRHLCHTHSIAAPHEGAPGLIRTGGRMKYSATDSQTGPAGAPMCAVKKTEHPGRLRLWRSS